MSALSWVQPADLLTHEFVASAEEGKDVADVVEAWTQAGGTVAAPVGGVGAQGGDEVLRPLALELLDVLDAREPDPTLLGREPDGLDAIGALLTPSEPRVPGGDLDDRVHGAWLGRAAGCLLGKPVEKIPRAGIRELLESQGRWPLREWFTGRGLLPAVAARWPWNRRSAATSLAENIAGMPEDDDLNFPLISLVVLEDFGPGFHSGDVATTWLTHLPGGRVFTAERVAYRNLLEGCSPPATATRRNPYREWIGAAIRTDLYGWTQPGNPRAAARLAHRDAVVSHVRAGVHAGMAMAAMCAEALVAADVDEVLDAGLSAVPPLGRYHAALASGVELGRAGVNLDEGLDALHADYGHLHWVHSLNNAALLGFALARGRGDLGESIATAVMGGWDTDSTAATAGAVCGAMSGARAIERRWVEPLQDRLASSVPGFDGVSFTELAARTRAVSAR